MGHSASQCKTAHCNDDKLPTGLSKGRLFRGTCCTCIKNWNFQLLTTCKNTVDAGYFCFCYYSYYIDRTVLIVVVGVLVLRGVILKGTYGKHENLYISLFYKQYLVLFTTGPVVAVAVVVVVVVVLVLVVGVLRDP